MPCLCPFACRSVPAVCGGDVRAVASGFGCGGRLCGPPALHTVSKLPVVSQLRPLFHVCPCRHLLLPPRWSTLPPHWPNHPNSLPVTSLGSPWKQIEGLTRVEYDFIDIPLMFIFLKIHLVIFYYFHNVIFFIEFPHILGITQDNLGSTMGKMQKSSNMPTRKTAKVNSCWQILVLQDVYSLFCLEQHLTRGRRHHFTWAEASSLQEAGAAVTLSCRGWEWFSGIDNNSKNRWSSYLPCNAHRNMWGQCKSVKAVTVLG